MSTVPSVTAKELSSLQARPAKCATEVVRCRSTKRGIHEFWRLREPMKLASAVTFLVATLVLLFTVYMHDSAHRYDVVIAAAGSGGSQQDVGSTEAVAYLIDHKTGRVWQLQSELETPGIRLPCPKSPNVKETDHGCEALSRTREP
jgi:hypothetical protein